MGPEEHHNEVGNIDPQSIDDNFADLHPPLNRLQAITEASRCTYCYDAPCINACPTGIDIPTFIHQIRTENVEGAAKTILSENIMGGTCARACPTEVLCEQACVRNHDQGNTVEIGLLQRFAVDTLMDNHEQHPFERAPSTGKRLAVIGAGPAGLSCAHRAAMLGHEVTVYEAREKSGGLNEYGLAAYKMVDEFAQKEVSFLLGIGGIEIIHGKKLGTNLSLDELRKQFDAVFLGVGLGSTNQLNLDGESKAGVEDAIEFIDTLRQTKDKSSLSVGQDVIVIGGGNTAIDAAVQAKRLGAENVTLVYRRGEDNMSATPWEVDLARKNGVTVRLWAKPIALNGAQNIETVTFERTALANGKLVGTGRTYQLPTDSLLKAIGQTLYTDVLGDIELSGSKVQIDEHYQTSLPMVFAGGDCINTGEDLTVQAVEDGKRAAHAITELLAKQ